MNVVAQAAAKFLPKNYLNYPKILTRLQSSCTINRDREIKTFQENQAASFHRVRTISAVTPD
ncbi:MAG: hypothetical protein Fur0035_12190 [Anaerolineales bacterium]